MSGRLFGISLFLSSLCFTALSLTSHVNAAVVYTISESASEASAITISITEQGTAQRELDAVVLIAGPVTVAGRTANGRVTFDRLPAGEYTITVKSDGFVSKTIALNVPIDGPTIGVRLRRSTVMRKIGVARSSKIASSTLPQTQTALSASAVEALVDTPGLALIGGGTEGGGRLTVSLRGHDPSQTQVTIAGVPANVPGVAANLAGLDLDLFDDTSVDTRGSAGGGSLSFQTINPTPSWQTLLESGYGSFARSSLSASTQGTMGRTGLAVAYATRELTSPLDGQTYPDQSGANYKHDGQDSQRGVSFVSDPVAGEEHIRFTAIHSQESSDLLCTLWSARLPCGFGPGNRLESQFDLTSISDTTSLGPLILSGSYYHVSSTSVTNASAALVEHAAAPYSSSSGTDFSGVLLNGSVTSGLHTINASVNAGNVGLESALSVHDISSSRDRSSYVTAKAADLVRLARDISVGVSAEDTRFASVPDSFTYAIRATQRLRAGSSLALAATLGHQVNADGTTTALSPPAALAYDCASGYAFGGSPGAPRSLSSVKGISASFDAPLATGHLSVDIFSERETHASLTTFVDANALTRTLPANYLNDVDSVFGATCTTRNSARSPALYFSTLVPGLSVRYNGADVRATWSLGKHVRQDFALAFLRVSAVSTNSLLLDPLSLFHTDGQLLGIPIVSFYDTYFYSPNPASNVEFLAGIKYAGPNNAQNLPPHLLVNVGARERLAHGQVALLLSNLSNAEAGVFARFGEGPNLTTRSGLPVPTLSSPETPRRLDLSYSVGVGRSVTAHDHLLEHIAEADHPEDILIPGTLVMRWPVTPPVNALRVNNAPVCVPADNAIAGKLLGDLRRALRPTTSVGTSWTNTDGSVDGTQVATKSNGPSVAVRIRTTRISVATAIAHCAELHVGRIADAERSRVPYESSASLTLVDFYYAPQVGIYYIEVPKPDDLLKAVRLYTLPSSEPRDPFAIDEKACPAALRARANDFLAALRAHFTQSDARGDELTVTKHGKDPNVWFAVVSDDIGTLSAVVSCGHVSSASKDELERRGLGFESTTQIHYAPAIGLYVAR